MERLRTTPAVGKFKLTEIGRERHDDVSVTNDSDGVVDFFDFLQTILVADDGVVRPEGDFAVVGGSTTGDGLQPGEATTVTVAFRPQPTGPRDLEAGRKIRRQANIAVLDADGAVAGTIALQGTARPPSAETLDDAKVADVTQAARTAASRPPAPRSYEDMRHHLMAARDLVETGERADASELVDAIEARMTDAATYDQIHQAARKHGLGARTATEVVGRLRSELTFTAIHLRGTTTVLPTHMERLLTMLQVAEEPLKLTFGEIESAPTLQVMNDATPAVLAGKGAKELGETAHELVTDATFAAGFGVGVLEGAGGALKDLATGVEDALALAFDLAKAWLTGGMIGVSLTVAGKLDDFLEKMPGAIDALGSTFSQGWNHSESFDRGNFRGEVIGYVSAQIAIIVISGGTAAEGVAFASLSRWGKVARLVQSLDAASDIVGWARASARGVKGAEKLIEKTREARGALKADAPPPPFGPDTPSPPGAPDAPATSGVAGAAAVARGAPHEAGDVPRDACFVAGTLVRTVDGLVPIERLAIGQRLLAADASTDTRAARGVMQTFMHRAKAVLDVVVGDITITCTPEHPFWIARGGWRRAGELVAGDVLWTAESQAVPVTSIARRPDPVDVYNVTVDELSTYHVSPLAVLVHNKPMSLDEQANFHVRREGILETITEVRAQLDELKKRARRPEHLAKVAELERDAVALERAANAAKFTPRPPDVDPATPMFDPLTHPETLETRLVGEVRALERQQQRYGTSERRPVSDEETVLADGSGNYVRTSREYQGRTIYTDDAGKYYYVDNSHEGVASEIEVFSPRGEHLGTMTPDGVFQPEGRVRGRTLKARYR